MGRSAVVTAGGDVTTVLALARYASRLTSPRAKGRANDDDTANDDELVIAADQGWRLARRLDLDVDILIGDFDSLDADELAEARSLGVEVRAHPAVKDATDLELALQTAVDAGATDIVVCDGGGDRFDHAMANLLTAAGFGGRARMSVVTPEATVTVVTGSRELGGEVGEIVTLLAIFGPARGVSTTGLLYPLSDELLSPGSSRGVSNELVAPTARVTVGAGTLLAVQPGPTKEHP